MPGDPDSPLAPNLTLLTLAGWSEQDFVTAMRTGVTVSGKQLDNELSAVWLLLSSLESREFGK